MNSWLVLLHLAQGTSHSIPLFVEQDIDAAVVHSLCSFISLKLLNELILLKSLNWPLPCPFCIYFCENCASYAIDFKQMSKIMSQRGNEFLQPARVDDSLGMAAGLYRCSCKLCKGRILNVFSFGLVLGAGAALGCGRDRETGGFYLHREMRLIWYVLHNTIIDMLIVLPLLAGLQWRCWDGAVLLSLTCSNQSLLTSGWTKVHDRFGQLSQSCVRLPFFLCFSLWYQRKICHLGLMTVIQMNLMWGMKAKQWPSFYVTRETVSFSYSDIVEMLG